MGKMTMRELGLRCRIRPSSVRGFVRKGILI